jgi:(aminoalkyl)phosphonate N-acetyltransferase
MEQPFIRPAVNDDFDAIYRFVCGLEEEEFDKDALREIYHHCLKREDSIYLIAVVADRPVGYLSCHGRLLLHHCGKVFEIEEFYIEPECRSKGIGRLLLAALHARLASVPHVLLEVCSNMLRESAHRFYEANGFEKTSFKFKMSETGIAAAQSR